jgi:Ca-activated chloride channel family protein
MHVSTHLDVDLVALEAEDQVTLMLDLAAPAGAADQQRPPATVQLVLDRSGSMGGARLDVAKRAIDLLIGRLKPDDRLGVVAFDDEVSVVVPARPLGDKALARQAVAAVQPGGMTNLSGALLRGLQEARRVAGDAGATVLVLSDGHANVGEVDPGRLGAVTAKARERRITTSTVGVGLDYDERLMAALARGGAGNAHFAEEADAAGAQLAGEVEGLLSVTAQAASVLVAPTAGVQSVTVWNDLPGHGTADGIMLEVGDLYAGEERKLILTFDVPRMAALGLAKIADVTLRWVALPDLEEHTVEIPILVNVVPGDQAAGRVPDPVVRSELAFQQAQRTKRDAAQAMREGRVDDAVALYVAGGAVLTDAALTAEPAQASELRTEIDVMDSLAGRARWDDRRRVAKESEADSGWKSRKRGRGDRR